MKFNKIVYYIRYIYSEIFGYGLENFLKYCREAFEEYLTDTDLELSVIESNIVVLHNRNIQIFCWLIPPFTVETKLRQNTGIDIEDIRGGIELYTVISSVDEKQDTLREFKPVMTDNDVKEDVYNHFAILGGKYCLPFIKGDPVVWKNLQEYNEMHKTKFGKILKTIDELISNEITNRELIYNELLKIYDDYKWFVELEVEIEEIERKTNHLTIKEKELLSLAKDHLKFRWL